MQDICEATGLSRGGLYRHFGSTAEIMREVIMREQGRADTESHMIYENDRGAKELLDEFLEVQRRFLFSEHAALESAMLEFALSSEEGRMAHSRRIERSWQRIEHLILKGQQEGVFGKGDARALAYHTIMTVGSLRAHISMMHYTEEFIDEQLALIKNTIVTDYTA